MTTDIVKVINENRELKKFSDPNRLSKEAIPYIGQPKQSEDNPDKIFLRLNPLSSNGALLEFKLKDLVFAEDVKTVTQNDGTAFQIAKIWIRKGSIGIKLEPFAVQDFQRFSPGDLANPAVLNHVPDTGSETLMDSDFLA